MSTVLVTGANRGLGLEFCQQYAVADWQVIACCREPKAAEALNNLVAQYPNIEVHALDVTDFSSIERLALQLDAVNLDVLINNAGVYGDTAGHGFGALDYVAWTKTLLINVQAPVKMAEMFLPHLKRGKQKLIVSISSLMGSIADNGSGGSILYRSSKAALNAAMKSIALDIAAHNVGVLIFHPGWVKTDMGGSDAPLETNTSIAGMRQVIANFTMAQSGCFVKFDGTAMPW